MTRSVIEIDKSNNIVTAKSHVKFSHHPRGAVVKLLTGDVTTVSTTAHASRAHVRVLSFTWDVPEEYHHLNTVDLECYGCINWSGEIQTGWDAMLTSRLYYGSGLTSFVDSARNTSSNYETRNNGNAIPVPSHFNNFSSTLDCAVVSSRFYISNCPVSVGSQLRLDLYITQNATETTYHNRTRDLAAGDNFNHELGTTNFFLALKPIL